MSNTYIIGHNKPDTDAVVAAMAYAYLCQNLECLNRKGAIPLIADPLNPEASFIFDHLSAAPPNLISDIVIKPEDKIILVDHNEETQIPKGIQTDQIVEIIDHHKANLNLTSPIFLTFKPWGSTTTIIEFLMHQNHSKPDKKLATLMLSAILSDTVGFKSATTTQQDKDAAKRLNNIADIDDIEKFTLNIFKAKSDISSLSDEQIVTNDYKIFEFDKKTFINQLETVEQSTIIANKKDSLLSAMAQTKKKEGVDLLFVAISDILQVNTKLLILSEAEAEVASKAFGGTVKDNVLDIGPKLSRKKEIAPAIEKALQ